MRAGTWISGILILLAPAVALGDTRVLEEPIFRGVVFPEVLPAEALGSDVAGIGDFDGDGIDDLGIGAGTYFIIQRPSAAYLVFGRREFPGVLDLATDGRSVRFATPDGTFGSDVLGGGDLDGDGRSELWVHQYWKSYPSPLDPHLYLIYGSADLAGQVPVEEIGVSIRGAVLTGSSLPTLTERNPIATVGDLNGDGVPDLAIGQESARSLDGEVGQVSILFGSPHLTGTHDLDDLLDASRGVRVLGSRNSGQGKDLRGFGALVAGAGDVNGDGLADVVAGDPEYRNASFRLVGAVRVVFGAEDLPPVLRVEELGARGLTIENEEELPAGNGIPDVFGGGDLDGDGFSEFGFSFLELAEGRAVGRLFVARGGPALPQKLTFASLRAGTHGFELASPLQDRERSFAKEVVMTPDEDGDGRPELFVGVDSPGNANLILRGDYPILPGEVARPLHAFEPAGSSGTGSNIGRILDAAGDVNADGTPDYVIGSPDLFAETTDPQASRVFLLFGGFEREVLSITAVSPSKAPVGETLTATVTGTGFTEGTRVFFGELEAAEVEVEDPHTMNVRTPFSSVAGTVDLEVVHPDSRRVVLKKAFSFSGVTRLKVAEIADTVVFVAQDSEYFRTEVLGDIDGDGLEDFALNGTSSQGSSYIIYGGTEFTGQVTEQDLSPKAVRIRASSGRTPSVQPLGDLDGDGDAEYAVHQYESGDGRNFVILFEGFRPGVATDFEGLKSGPEAASLLTPNEYDNERFDLIGRFDADSDLDLVLGGSNGFSGWIAIIRGPIVRGDLLALASDPRVTFISDARYRYPGFYGLSPIGDFNGDGRADLGFHQPLGEEDYLVILHGQNLESQSIELADLEATGIAVKLKNVGGFFSTGPVSRAEDVNGDGFDDMFVSYKITHSDGELGFVGLVLGRDNFDPDSTWNSEVGGTGGFLLHGEERLAWMGSVDGSPDLDAEGGPDLVIGSERPTEIRGGLPKPGVVHILHDVTEFRGEHSLSDVSLPLTVIEGTNLADRFGTEVAILGDQDGDGLHELLVTAPNAGLISGRAYLMKGGILFGAGRENRFLRGDTNLDGRLNITDPIGILGGLFQGGPPILCEDAADANDDGQLNISDAIRVLNFLFAGGPAPPAPHPGVGQDPTDDGLSCRNGVAV